MADLRCSPGNCEMCHLFTADYSETTTKIISFMKLYWQQDGVLAMVE
jgi:hypothetical protein